MLGFTPTSSNAWYARLFSDVKRAEDFVSFKSPNVIACVGQASAHAVTTLPSTSGAPAFLASNLPGLQALYTHAALLHNATTSHRNIWVQHHPHQAILGRVEVCKFLVARVVKPIEPPHFVGAVVRAVPCADAPVVRHLVQSFIGVRCCSYWTNRLTWCVVAMLAHHWHVHRLWIAQKDLPSYGKSQ